MTQTEKLKQELKDLGQALKDGSISTNEYSSMYHSTYNKIKNIS